MDRAAFGLLAALAMLELAGCGHSAPAKAPAVPRAVSTIRLAWLPLEPLISPDVASTVNDRLGRLTVPGASRSYRAPVSMEVAQLAIECIEASSQCYAAVGRSVGADRLLWAEIAPAPESEESLRVAVVLFDVRGSAIVTRVEHTYGGLDAVRAGVAALVEHALDAPPSQAARSKTP